MCVSKSEGNGSFLGLKWGTLKMGVKLDRSLLMGITFVRLPQ